MNKPLPDSHIRKAVFDAINNISVDGILIPCYDVRVTTGVNAEIPQHYIIQSTQSNEVDKANKCEYFWDSNLVLDITTTYPLPGNPGTRVLVDNITEAVKDATNDLVLDVASGLTIINQSISFPPDISTTTKNENIYRKFIRFELKIA